MEETAVDEDYFAAAGEDEVGLAGQVFAVEAKAVAHAMHERAHDPFGACVPTADARHVIAALGRCVNVRHASCSRFTDAMNVLSSSMVMLLLSGYFLCSGCGTISRTLAEMNLRRAFPYCSAS